MGNGGTASADPCRSDLAAALLGGVMTPDDLRKWGDEFGRGHGVPHEAADAWEADRRRLADAHFMIGELSKQLRNERWMNEVDSP